MGMPDIVLTTLNAKYAHTAFGLRYLMANLGALRERAQIVEFEVGQRAVDMLEILLSQKPKIVGLGVYIWNVEQATRLVGDLKRVQPDIIVILGGPEVSYEFETLPIVELADYVITGEADLAFARVCGEVLAGRPPSTKVIPAELPAFGQLQLPYDLYSQSDLDQRVVYVEASRGCPFSCEFCLSSLDIPVRQAPLGQFLEAMQALLDRGLMHFKFVDRTFNLNLAVGRSILSFFLERYRPGLFLHFEMIPDRLPESLCDLIEKFPAGALQFEVGIQTFNADVSELVSRRQNNAAVEKNLRFLRERTGVHVHADLIVGLPGESIESFGAGFNRLVALYPQEIQVGMLKRLRGTPIVRHDLTWGMIYSQYPPYEILQTKLIDYAAMQRLRRFARYWDLVANSGNFIDSTPLIWREDLPFESFLRFSDWLFAESGQTNGISLKRLAELVFRYLTEKAGQDTSQVAGAVWRDYQRGGRSDHPPFLRPYLLDTSIDARLTAPRLPRQARHAARLGGDR